MKKENYLRIPDIIIKALNQEANLEERKTLQEWLSQSKDNQIVYEKFKQKENLYALIKDHDKIDSLKAWDNINKMIDKKNGRSRLIILSVLKYAAILAIPLLIGGYFLYQRTSSSESNISFNKLEEQINKLEESSLIMADGTIVNLNSSVKGDSIVEIDGTQITKDKSEILYSNNKAITQQEIQFNTLITPKSKVFNVTLSDGTKVWLNASSAIKYPTQFSADIRKVYLTGEAYFEVTTDKSRPFIVSTNDMEIEVFGTSFNVMAYPNDNSVETTLVEGSVKVKASKYNLVLEPGAQAKFDKTLDNLQETKVNTELYTSWKVGKYIFEYENLQNVMTKLSRWYDAEITFLNTNAENLHFSGTLYKYNDIKQTLHIIELATNVKFEIIENTVLVSRK
ncbi:MAG: hypothetical protein CVU00_09865 [Bacteroidetes bacterium HGW-Bacteroidetes-17]|jgi:ferric-dicitrate binding protein FerR (iron transport regulator)|nr:MAG: hypothetical protein CVU00_09865 [Bacteroidetes bacterium HGW-Bacteroidetes-17]